VILPDVASAFHVPEPLSVSEKEAVTTTNYNAIGKEDWQEILKRLA
jgi:hypothetical protein